ncbi:hypothetical protein [Longimicrobium sp.]|uniref:hypothetical protein n=1 Tax=Longimicrobium sp. TaxID=2029185 RepID=UPI002E359204|nr:hypothetical protein [Longimicrobium sp.]HEX6038996.1 hypothetical protein [Longimicrobium sp.]
MYSTCIFCNGGLGENESIEHFPVGRRLAFDAEKGRLWAVCPTCGRWNLSALEERWEAIEDCERRFRGTSLRTSTENIGLARLRDGTDLVRVGRPLRPEFAAWRYGAQFSGRQKRAWLSAASLGGIALGVGAGLVLAPAAALVGLPVVAAAEWKKMGLPRGAGYFTTAFAQRRLVDDRGVQMLTWDRSLNRVRLRTNPAATPRWSLEVRTENRVLDNQQGYIDPDPRYYQLTGQRALRALAVFMAHANAQGGSGGQVQAAVRMIDRARTPDAFLAGAEEAARKQGQGYRDVWAMPLEIRMAMEMAAHEDAERRALEGELAELERHWREAEEVAAIADGLAVPPAVEEKMDTLRAARAAWAARAQKKTDDAPSRTN